MKKNYLFCSFVLFFLVSLSTTFAQQHITGTVVDAKTGNPLPFASVYDTNNSSLGTMTDIDGVFKIKISNTTKSLSSSYLGYESQTKPVEGDRLHFELQPRADQLKEVVVNSKDNPAHPIIRKAIANRERNNPENSSSFKYNSYNKIVFDYRFANKEEEDSLRKEANFENSHILIMESVTERIFKAPSNSFEKVIGTRVSGFENPYFASLATDFQPFGFYSEVIELLDIPFLNPIGDGSLDKYKYKLEETLQQNNDTIHLISFEPLPNKNFDGLKGVLYINTNNYAIQNVLASPADESVIQLNIQQKYVWLNNEQWFPEQLNFELLFKESPSKEMNLYASGKSYITDVSLNPELNRKDFPVESVSITKEAPKQDSLFWDKYRVERLDSKEERTYEMIDSLGQEYNFDSLLAVMEKLPEGKIPIGMVDLDLNKTFVINQHEGFRLGTGFFTNEKLFENLSFGGFFGFGLKDNEWKYGGKIIQHISRKHELLISVSYENEIQEVGTYGIPRSNAAFDYSQRNFLAYKMDHIQQYQFHTEFRAFKYAKWKFDFSQAKITPLYTYIFGDENGYFNSFHNSKVEIGLTYAYKEKIVSSFGRRYSMGTDYPVLTINYSRGIKDVLQSDFNYNKIEARIDHNFFTKNLGTTTYKLEAGYVDKPLPYGLLFTGEGSYDEDFPVVIQNNFQTMLPYEFLSSRYANLYSSHDFGSLLFKTGDFKPGLIIHNNFGWGDLPNPEMHYFVPFKTKEHVFAETGLEITRLLEINYINMGYLGLGAGAFYRYGAYNFDRDKDNFVFKFNLVFNIL